MSDELFELLLEDITSFESDGNFVTCCGKEITDGELNVLHHWNNVYHYLNFFVYKDNPPRYDLFFRLIIADKTIREIRLYPKYFNKIKIKITDNGLEYYNDSNTYLDTIEVYNIDDLYIHIESIYKSSKSNDYFACLPKLSSLQYILDKMNPNKNEQNYEIIIDI